jgi:hypothetical protein
MLEECIVDGVKLKIQFGVVSKQVATDNLLHSGERRTFEK